MEVSWHTNSVFNSRTYFLSEGERCWIVDCGDIDAVMAEGKRIEGVLLTHVHYDHIYGLPRLLELFPDARVYTNREGAEILGNSRKNFSRYHDDPVEISDDPRIIVVDDGQNVELLGGTAEAFFTPGHAPSCVTWQVGQWLFTGDSLIPGIKTITNLPGGNKGLAIVSEEAIRQRAQALGLEIMPGHAGQI